MLCGRHDRGTRCGTRDRAKRYAIVNVIVAREDIRR
jgi:hypothetical protein